MDRPLLTPYDELPVHQSSQPFSVIPSTDYGWDDGYYFGMMNARDRLFLDLNFRVNPNTDIVGGAALFVRDDQQSVVRLSRVWREDFGLHIGPLSLEVVEPMRTWRLRLEPQESGLAFDVLWEATTPPILEAHHLVHQRGRATTDQSRYNQPGRASGWVEHRGTRVDLTPDVWGAARDHSWGLYVQRPPFAPDQRWLPPSATPARKRALRFWTIFSTPTGPGGFFQVNELSDGSEAGQVDVFSSPFEGRIHRAFDDPGVALTSYHHDLTFEPGSRLLRTADFSLVDEAGDAWHLAFQRAMMPWSPRTLGYSVGGWRDGGNFHSYHGPGEFTIEWDEPVDISAQPMPPITNVPVTPGDDRFAMRSDAGEPEVGTVITCHVTVTTPQGERFDGGTCHVDCSLLGDYPRYGFTADAAPAPTEEELS